MRDSSKSSAKPIDSGTRTDGNRAASHSEDGWVLTPQRQQALLRELDESTRVLIGNAGDHPLVLNLLVQAYQASMAEDFQSRLDEPSYEPSDRLLVQKEGRLIGHVRVSKQIGWFSHERVPLAILNDFFTLPEYRAAGYEKALLDVAEAVAEQEGSVLGLVRTDQPEWFRERGWSSCRGQGHTRANTRAILSHFDAQQANQRRRREAIEIRSWRHFELDPLRHIYAQVASNMWGALYRSEETWQWLVGRKAQDQILIAVEKVKVKSNDDSPESNVVGYAVVRDSCIVEMMTLPGYTSVRSLLVRRACRDAIDRDHHFVSLHTPANDPIHELLVTAGGSWINAPAALDGRWMLKLLSPSRWVERLYPILHERAGEASISRPLEIEFDLGDEHQQIAFTRRSCRLETVRNATTEPLVRCGRNTLQDLLTSNLTLLQAEERGKLKTTNDEILRELSALFPPKLLWQSPFPLLRL